MRSRPKLQEDARYWHASFQQLSTSRPAGMGGALPITLAEVEAYCRFAGIPEQDRWEFLQMIRRIDLEFMHLLETKQAITLPQPKG